MLNENEIQIGMETETETESDSKESISEDNSFNEGNVQLLLCCTA